MLAYFLREIIVAYITTPIVEKIVLSQEQLGGEYVFRGAIALTGVLLIVLAIGLDNIEQSVKTAYGWRQGLRQARERHEPETQELRTFNDEGLRQRCRELYAEIFRFSERQRENKEDSLQSDYMLELLDKPAGNKIRSEHAVAHDRFMVGQYRKQFGGDVLALANDLAKHNCITTEDQDRLKNPTNPQDIEYIAQLLDAICRGSDES